jgi:hypothetical protein
MIHTISRCPASFRISLKTAYGCKAAHISNGVDSLFINALKFPGWLAISLSFMLLSNKTSPSLFGEHLLLRFSIYIARVSAE